MEIEVLPTGVLDALPIAVVLVDGARRIIGWNAAAEVLYGYSDDQVLGRPVLDVLFDRDDQSAVDGLLDAVEPGMPWEGDFRVRRRDGALLVSSFRLAAAEGRVAWVATDGIDQGLAEQERSVLLSAEHAARATAEEALGLVEAIVAAAPVAIAVFDLGLRYVRVNDAYAALSGVPAAGHVGGLLGEVVPVQADVAADLRRVITTGRTILGRPLELPSLTPGGPSRHFTVSYFPVSTSGGARFGAGLVGVDVTESKRSEAERVTLLLRAEAAQQRLSVLATASTVLTTTMELDELLNRLTRVLTPAAADWCVIELFGPGGEVDHVAVSHRDRVAADELAGFLRTAPFSVEGNGPIAEVVRTGQARLLSNDLPGHLHDAADDRGWSALATRFALRSTAIVPIETRGQVLGVLILSTEATRALEDDDLDLAVEVSHRAALAVGNARAFQQEHQIAETLQRALLPATVPSVRGLELAVRYLAATDRASVGGDWYDVLAFDDGSAGLVVGDVVGHDIAASTSMGQLRSALRAYAMEGDEPPAATLARVDAQFARLGLTYATCVYGVIDPDAATFRWSNAGHPPPMLVRDGRASFLTDGAGVLLGVTSGGGVQEASAELRPGDLLVLYTDGLIERRGESLQAGLDRLARVAAGVAAADAGAMCDALLEALVPTTTSRDDDVAILVAQVQGRGQPALGQRLPFELVPVSASLARGFTAGVLHQAGLGELADTAVLLVSELVTNAVRHTRGGGALVVSIGLGSVEFAVEDGDPRPPETRHPSHLDESGRGFLLVEALADEWGVRPLPEGKATWFTLRTDG